MDNGIFSDLQQNKTSLNARTSLPVEFPPIPILPGV